MLSHLAPASVSGPGGAAPRPGQALVLALALCHLAFAQTPPAQGDRVCTGQQSPSVTPMAQASTGMATPRRLNQTARIAVSRRITLFRLSATGTTV